MIDSSERWQHWVYTFIDGSRNDNVAVFFLLFFWHFIYSWTLLSRGDR